MNFLLISLIMYTVELSALPILTCFQLLDVAEVHHLRVIDEAQIFSNSFHSYHYSSFFLLGSS